MSKRTTSNVYVKFKCVEDCMKKYGWDQKDVATRAGIDPRTLNSAKNGHKISANSATSIASAIGIRYGEFIDLEASCNTGKRHKQIVGRWINAFFSGSIEELPMICHKDLKVKVGTTNDVPGAGSFQGISEELSRIDELFSVADDFRLESKLLEATPEGTVYQTSKASARVIRTNERYSVEYVNRFEFENEKIISRQVYIDFSEMKSCLTR